MSIFKSSINQAKLTPVVHRLTVDAPAEWADKRILHLTDLHLIAGRGDGERIAKAVAGITCDLIAITGDIMEHEDALPDLQIILDSVRCSGPTLAVLGNHDIWGSKAFRKYEPHPFIAEFKSRVFRFLMNESPFPYRRDDEVDHIVRALRATGITVYRNEAGLAPVFDNAWVIGLDDPYSGMDDLHSALLDLPKDARPLGLVHAPAPAPAMLASGAFFVMCGHTHGNQIYLPGTNTLLHLGQKGWSPRRGVFDHPGGKVLVSSGAGHLIPLRINVPPEVWVVDLTPEPGARRKLVPAGMRQAA